MKRARLDQGSMDLHVVCLTGEVIEMKVARTTLGREVQRMVSEHLPCKPGAKIALHHMESRLILSQSLQEQGIGPDPDGTASLSCTRIPTNLYEAMQCVKGFNVDEAALTGLTRLEDAPPGEYLCYLPRTLQTLTLCGKGFESYLMRATLPTGLRSFGFSNQFDPSLALPSGLQSLTLGSDFNQSLEGVTLPSGLQSLTFGEWFDQSLERVTLPSRLQSLTFGCRFNQCLEHVTLPSGLQSLTFGDVFNQSLVRLKLPRDLLSLNFGLEFNQNLERVKLPTGLQSLTFGYEFNQSWRKRHCQAAFKA